MYTIGIYQVTQGKITTSYQIPLSLMDRVVLLVEGYEFDTRLCLTKILKRFVNFIRIDIMREIFA